MFTFATDYYLFAFAGSLGVIQIAAALGRLKGLLFIRSHLVASGFSVALVIAAFVWFFSTDNRNLNDYEGGLDANVQALLFFLGAATAMATTAVASSIVNARMDGGGPAPGEGFGALKRSSYARALAYSLRYWGKEWRTQMKSYFSG